MKKIPRIACLIVIGCLLLLPLNVSALETGDTAPDFTAASTLGEISLADYKGKKHVVLALYFAVFTSV